MVFESELVLELVFRVGLEPGEDPREPATELELAVGVDARCGGDGLRGICTLGLGMQRCVGFCWSCFG